MAKSLIMRRNELLSLDEDDFIFVMENAEIGNLGLVDDNDYARIIPINFVAIDKNIYYHGALEGEKYDLMKSPTKASFSVHIPYSFVPSYYQNEKYACPATHLFKSVHIRGIASVVSDIDEKAEALQKLMEKYQPEGRYIPISGDLSLYKNALGKVGVFMIKSDEITVKIKFGQNEKDEVREAIIDLLQKRDTDLDRLTIAEMHKYAKN